jgi:hypothetical protein
MLNEQFNFRKWNSEICYRGESTCSSLEQDILLFMSTEKCEITKFIHVHMSYA